MPQRKIIDPRKQFSKRLARYGAIYWGFFLTAVIVLVYFRPETANACIYFVLIVTANKMLDTIAYTDNSKSEKILLAMLDKTRMELTLGTRKVEKSEEEDETEYHEED